MGWAFLRNHLVIILCIDSISTNMTYIRTYFIGQYYTGIDLPRTRSVWDCTCPRAAGAASAAVCPAWWVARAVGAAAIWVATGMASKGSAAGTARPATAVAGGLSAAVARRTASSSKSAAGTAEKSSAVRLHVHKIHNFVSIMLQHILKYKYYILCIILFII